MIVFTNEKINRNQLNPVTKWVRRKSNVRERKAMKGMCAISNMLPLLLYFPCNYLF